MGQWGDILNDYLSVSHQTDGTLKPLAQSQVANLTTNLAAKAPLVSPTFSGTVTVPTPANPTDATTKGYVDGQVATGATPDASPSTKGKIQLAGDLAGTAASPTVVNLNGTSLAGLTTGLLKNTTGTGVPSIATAADIPDISATYATATALTTEASTARTAESKAVPRWAPTTTYTLGQQVVSPNNDVVSAIAGFTSGASYVPADWAVSSTYGPLIQAVNTVTTGGASQTIPDMTTATANVLTLTSAHCALTFPPAGAGKAFLVTLKQGTGGYLLVDWPSGVKWPMDVVPVLQTPAGSVDEFTFYSADTTWRGSLDASYST